MKLTDFTMLRLGEFIAGDPEGWPYRSGPDLVRFFNSHGFRDVYGGGFPTRRIFAQNRIKALNDTPRMKDVIRDMLDPRLWMSPNNGNGDVASAVNQINEILRYDDYEVIKDGKFYKVRERSGSLVELETPFEHLSNLSEILIEEQIRKCKEKIETGDYSGAITNARSLIEAVCLHIEETLTGSVQGNDGDVIKLFNRARKLLNLDPGRKDISDPLKQVLTGLSSIVAGLAGMRNKMSDAHAGIYRPNRHHAKLAVNAAQTLVDFIFETKAYQEQKGTLKVSLGHSEVSV